VAKGYRTPWDIYVDERKVAGEYSLGFLVVPNTASFMHKLYRCRERPADQEGRVFVTREIHWNRPHLDSLSVAVRWIDTLFQHNGARFYVVPWPTTQTKAMVVLRFLSWFTRRKQLTPPYNVVVFLDFDSDHAKAKIQNTIRDAASIARCYHLDSTNNDCLQCCDLLLGATVTLGDNPSSAIEFATLDARLKARDRLKDSEVKRYIVGCLASRIDQNRTSAYDFRSKGAGPG
jgi:hypothetical protein